MSGESTELYNDSDFETLRSLIQISQTRKLETAENDFSCLTSLSDASDDSGYASLDITPRLYETNDAVWYEDDLLSEWSSARHILCENDLSLVQTQDDLSKFQTGDDLSLFQTEDVIHQISGMPNPVDYTMPCVSMVSQSDSHP